MLSKFYSYILGFVGLLAGVLTAFGLAKRAGKKEEQAKQTEKALEQAKEANEISQANRSLSDADAIAKLRRDQRD